MKNILSVAVLFFSYTISQAGPTPAPTSVPAPFAPLLCRVEAKSPSNQPTADSEILRSMVNQKLVSITGADGKTYKIPAIIEASVTLKGAKCYWELDPRATDIPKEIWQKLTQLTYQTYTFYGNGSTVGGSSGMYSGWDIQPKKLYRFYVDRTLNSGMVMDGSVPQLLE